MLLMIDNYDSFTYNLVQYLGELGADVHVYRNDALTLDQIAAWEPAQIVISPGPCTPNEAGISVPLIRRFAGAVPILGVCLGHQAIGQAFGGQIVRAQRVMHGKLSPVTHDGRGVFTGLPSPFNATRYHSLAIERTTLPRVPRGHGDRRRRRDHGRAPSRAAGRGRAVPPGGDPDRARPRAAAQFPRRPAMTPRPMPAMIAAAPAWAACRIDLSGN